MTARLLLSLSMILFTGSALLLAAEQSPTGPCCPQCATAYRCRMVTKMVPVKKTVYETKQVPFCLHKIQHGQRCLTCEACPRFKRVLIKKEIVVGEKCVTECEPEAVSMGGPCAHCGRSF